ncbi:DUF1707 SHOCT-like domain-containing protein [Planosporangium mesophilum]|uniref:DUF1707 domain-containing protein n=1 Tax=Planosporangium mesophilum TaxID=689768 RepID=A0A8J3X2F4_9ACTN|nr:DUF1707 domain-containing protein [Planosporangium mesophilum]NJC85798.1 DUF1707 domain-containing protein [Planosporangium mesophilum]GII21858.1 hypothetical protein Pme01_14550 [Planosporangium mesophilum]
MDGLRVSDADRMRVVAALERHTAAGRLSLDEFSDRVGRALAAATRHDLARVTSDLPAEPASQSRQLLLAFLLAMLTMAGLALVLVLGR